MVNDREKENKKGKRKQKSPSPLPTKKTKTKANKKPSVIKSGDRWGKKKTKQLQKHRMASEWEWAKGQTITGCSSVRRPQNTFHAEGCMRVCVYVGYTVLPIH